MKLKSAIPAMIGASSLVVIPFILPMSNTASNYDGNHDKTVLEGSTYLSSPSNMDVLNPYADNYGSDNTVNYSDVEKYGASFEVLRTNEDSIYLHVVYDNNIFDGNFNFYDTSNNSNMQYTNTNGDVVQYNSDGKGDKNFWGLSYPNPNNDEYLDDVYESVNGTPLNKNGETLKFPTLYQYDTSSENEDSVKEITNTSKYYFDYLNNFYIDTSTRDNLYYIFPELVQSTNEQAEFLYIDSENIPTSNYYNTGNEYLKRYSDPSVSGEYIYYKVRLTKPETYNIYTTDPDGTEIATPTTPLVTGGDVEYYNEKTGEWTKEAPKASNYEDYSTGVPLSVNSLPKEAFEKSTSDISEYIIDSYPNANDVQEVVTFTNNDGYSEGIYLLEGGLSSETDYSSSGLYLTNYRSSYNSQYFEGDPDSWEPASGEAEQFYLYELNPSSSETQPVTKSRVSDTVEDWNIDIDFDNQNFSFTPTTNEYNSFDSNIKATYEVSYISDGDLNNYINSNRTYDDFIELINSIYSTSPKFPVSLNEEGTFDIVNVNLNNVEWTTRDGKKDIIENPYDNGLLILNPILIDVLGAEGSRVSALDENDWFSNYLYYTGDIEQVSNVIDNVIVDNSIWWVWTIVGVSSTLAVGIGLFYWYKSKPKLTENKKKVKKVWK